MSKNLSRYIKIIAVRVAIDFAQKMAHSLLPQSTSINDHPFDRDFNGLMLDLMEKLRRASRSSYAAQHSVAQALEAEAAPQIRSGIISQNHYMHERKGFVAILERHIQDHFENVWPILERSATQTYFSQQVREGRERGVPVPPARPWIADRPCPSSPPSQPVAVSGTQTNFKDWSKSVERNSSGPLSRLLDTGALMRAAEHVQTMLGRRQSPFGPEAAQERMNNLLRLSAPILGFSEEDIGISSVQRVRGYDAISVGYTVQGHSVYTSEILDQLNRAREQEYLFVYSGDSMEEHQLKPKRAHAVCEGCRNYCGSRAGGNLLVCAMHPYGPGENAESCADWDAELLE